jgi:hypothetical protein
MLIPVTQINAAGGAMAQLYDNIASIAIASWDVQGISQAYNHLKLIYTARGDAVATVIAVNIRFNNDSGAVYDYEITYSSNGTAAGGVAIAATGGQIPGVAAASATANKVGMGEVLIPNYTGTTFEKMGAAVGGRTESTAAAGQTQETDSFNWRSTAAINRITIFPTSGNFIAGSRLTIYGLL